MLEGPESVRQKVRGQLRGIVDGLRPGDRLPSERDLAERFGVARMTIRHAMDRLVVEGLIERRQGAGSFVLDHATVRTLRMSSFTDDMTGRGLTPSTRVLRFRRLDATNPLAAHLNVPEGTELLNFVRLRLASQIPIGLETSWLVASRVPGLTSADLEKSLFRLLNDRYNLEVVHATTTIDALVPSERVGELLEIPPNVACLRFRMIENTSDGHPLLVAHCLYRADKYQLHSVVGAPFNDSLPGEPV